MKNRLIPYLIMTLMACVGTSQANTIYDFALIDQQGKFHQLSWYGDQSAIVFFFQDTQCGDDDAALQQYAKLKQQFKNQPISFFIINSESNLSNQAVATSLKSLNIDFPVLMDESQLVAERLGITSSQETIVVNPNQWQITYQGSFEQNELSSILKNLANNSAPAAQKTPPTKGCPLQFEPQPAAISYSEDVAPILLKRCVSCHQEGGIAPWAMTSHEMVRGWSAMIKEVLYTKRMPPGQIDTRNSHTINDLNELPADEMRTLIAWINRGGQKDQGDDPLAAYLPDGNKWQLGEPDYVIKVPSQKVPANGIVDYRYIPIRLPFQEEKWVKGIEFLPGDQKALHHVIAYITQPGERLSRAARLGASQRESLGGYAPGKQPVFFRDNSGRLLKRRSNLLLQMHYTTTGKATTDETEIGLYFWDAPPKYVMSGGVAGTLRLSIPPYAKEHQQQAEQYIRDDAYLYSMSPHMHYRGKYMRYIAQYPDGREETILNVANYQFNWQMTYQLKQPLFLPKGTRVIAQGAFDNSPQNPFNPDPSRNVGFGLQSFEEMFFGYMTLRYEGDTP